MNWQFSGDTQSSSLLSVFRAQRAGAVVENTMLRTSQSRDFSQGLPTHPGASLMASLRLPKDNPEAEDLKMFCINGGIK